MGRVEVVDHYFRLLHLDSLALMLRHYALGFVGLPDRGHLFLAQTEFTALC